MRLAWHDTVPRRPAAGAPFLMGVVLLAVATARGASLPSTPRAEVSTPAATGRPAPIAAAARELDGPASDPARDHVPDLPFPSPPPEDMTIAGGVPTSLRDLVVVFAPTTTVAAANALLRSLPAVVVGGNPDAHTVLVRLTGPSDLARIFAAQTRLLDDPRVAGASVVTKASSETAPRE